jgi:Secretion system C-terminal sorting domain
MAALLHGAMGLQAQVANYNYSETSGTYTPVTGGTLLFNSSFDDAVYGPITVPAFMFDGGSYTQMWVSTNGFVTFGSAPSATNYTPLSSTETYVGAVSPFGANLASGASGLTQVRYRSLGYQLVVQWTNVRRAGESESFSFQARMNRYTGVIQFVYGPIVSGPSTSVTNFPQVGLRGPNNNHANNVKNRRVETGNQNWDHSLPGNNNASSCRFTSAAPAKYWVPGETYRFRNPGGGNGCEPPFVVMTVNTDCANSTFTITADVETIGDANNITVSTVPAGGVYANVGDGIYLLGPYAFGTIVTLNVANNSDANCGEQVTNITNAFCDCLGVPSGTALPGTACDDGDACTTGDTWTNDCDCIGTVEDSDNDGICDADDSCPDLAGEVGDACDDGNAGTQNDTIDGTCTCVGDACTHDLNLIFQTDGVSDISWELREQGTNTILQSGGGIYPASMGYSIVTCLPDGCFYLVVTDDAGDGIIGGGYILRVANAGRLIDNRNNFTDGTTSQIANDEGFCLPLGTDRLIFTSCDKLDWKSSPCGGEYIVANDNPDVTNEYGVNNANSGYEMWWFDPNGGYSFRRFQSHNTANGFSPGPTRACHFRINGWSGNQLQQGHFYNVKVRGRVNGTYNAWGPACRFMLDDVAAQCPRTKLLDIPDSPFLSCGTVKPIGTSSASRVYARPVKRMNANCVWVSANRYQFRFRIPAEGITVVKTSAVGQYFVNANTPLECSKTYEVDVRASFDGGATWCHASDPYGDVCYFTTSCPSMMAAPKSTEQTTVASRANLYPNPNRGDLLYLGLEHMSEGVSTWSIDIYDSLGKRVMARTVAATTGAATAIELQHELTAGMYVVHITAGETLFTERLVIQP